MSHSDGPPQLLERATGMKRAARTQFDAWSDRYDRSLLNRFLFWPAYQVMAEEIAHWYELNRRPFRLLDVGCGTGTFVNLIGGKNWPIRVFGLDYSMPMCEQARQKTARLDAGSSIAFINGDSEHLPFRTGAFDLITCANSFHHYPHQQTVVVEMHRLLAPGGRLILVDGFRDNIVGWVTFDVIITRIEGHVHHAPWPLMHEYFARAGFANIRRRKHGFWMPGLTTIGEVPAPSGPL